MNMKLITNPDEFFAELKTKDISIIVPILIIIGIAILAGINQYVLINKIWQIVPENLAQLFTIGAYIGVIGAFIGTFATWFIITAIMYGLSALLGGKGSFYRTFTFIGYGFLPSLVGSLIATPISTYYIINANISEINLTYLKQNPEVIITFLLPEEVIYSLLIINIAMIAWSLVIWSFALKHARDLSVNRALICVLVPTVPFGLYQIWRILALL